MSGREHYVHTGFTIIVPSSSGQAFCSLQMPLEIILYDYAGNFALVELFWCAAEPIFRNSAGLTAFVCIANLDCRELGISLCMFLLVASFFPGWCGLL